MSATRILVFTTVVLGVVSWGCRTSRISMIHHEPRPVVYTNVAVGHVCTEECLDHYYNGSEIVVLRRHRHGYGCGHRWDGHNWVVIRRPRRHANVAPRVAVTTTHHHGPACGCVYNRAGSKWVKVSAGHIHGEGCGHVFYNGRWSLTTKSPHYKKRDKIYPKRVRRGH